MFALGFLLEAAALATTTWSPTDKAANITLSNANLTAASAAANTIKLVRATAGRSSGKLYFEITIGATAGYSVSGLLPAAGSLTTDLSLATQAFSADSSGTVIVNTNAQAGGVTFAPGNVIAFAVDFTALKFWFRKNGAWATGDPVAGTGGWAFTAGTYFPVAELYANSVSHIANFGQSAFANTIPSGYSAWG